MPLTTVTPQMETGAIAFSAYQSVAQSLTLGTWTKVQLQSEEFDTNAFFDSATNYRFQPTVAGYYQINGVASGAGSPTQVAISIYKNGADFKKGTNIATSANSAAVSALISMNGSTDYLELWVYSGAAQSLTATANNTYFQGILVRQA